MTNNPDDVAKAEPESCEKTAADLHFEYWKALGGVCTVDMTPTALKQWLLDQQQLVVEEAEARGFECCREMALEMIATQYFWVEEQLVDEVKALQPTQGEAE